MSVLLQRFSGRSRLLAHSLLTGGAARAYRVLAKARTAGSVSTLTAFIQTLCQDEVSLSDDAQVLTRQPLVSLFSSKFKYDLLCFLHLIHSEIPRDVQALLHFLMQELNQNPWVFALTVQLRKDIEGDDLREDTLFTDKCAPSLKSLCKMFSDPTVKGEWDIYLNEHLPNELCTDDQTDWDLRKRKSKVNCSNIDAVLDEPQSKKRKLDLILQNNTSSEVVDMENKSSIKNLQPEKDSNGNTYVLQAVSHEGSSTVLPDHVKAAVPLIKDLLDSETEWNESCISTLKVFHECDINQLEILCAVLCLSETPEQSLPHFCCGLLALTPDLSHSTTFLIIKHLLLGKVVSLTEPASRCLVTAVTSLCLRYPRPTCQGLLEPVIKEGKTGTPQVDLFSRLIKDCLDPQHRALVFQMILVQSWNEGLLSVINELLDLKIELSKDVFSEFIKQLSLQSSRFSKSMKFAKMMLTVLTKFQSYVNATCLHTLSCCISFNETFLKKSLQAALIRISF